MSLTILITRIFGGNSEIEVVSYLTAQWISTLAVFYEAGSMKRGRFKNQMRITAFVSFIMHMAVISYSVLSSGFGMKSFEDFF